MQMYEEVIPGREKKFAKRRTSEPVREDADSAAQTAELALDVWWQAIQSRDRRFDGRFFVAAVTTRVYCRPSCPMPFAKANNIALYPSAAAAETAGFRPCLRCRPETSPATPAWLGTSAVISRALRLIREGALNEDGVEQLAERLGIGARQLRRLFVQHLGASPVQIASTHRVHFARNLIEETDLPMSAVAMNAGFKSIRQFNHTLKSTFGHAPTELRASRTDYPGDQSSSGLEIRLSYRPPLNWPALLSFLRFRATPGVEEVTSDAYRRTIETGNGTGLIEVKLDDEKLCLVVRIELSDYAGLMSVVERVRRIFDLGADPMVVTQHLSGSSVLKALVNEQPGIRVPGAWDGFELSISAILSRYAGIRQSVPLMAKLASEFGMPIETRFPGLARLFPRPEALRRAELSRIGIRKEWARPIRVLSQAISSGRLGFESSRSLAETISRFCAVPGIDEDIAQYIAMRACGEPDACPLVCIGLVGRTSTQPFQRGISSVLASSEKWRPWKAYGVMHVWTATERSA